MPTAQVRLGRQVSIDVEEARAWDVAVEVERPPAAGISQIPATVDELVPQGYQLPAGEGGSGTEAGWIT
jgi:hypothetical protein